jgi:hypothetical protein
VGAGAVHGLVITLTATLGRISNTRRRATQFWDKERLVSHSMGEHDRHSVVWDYIAVYPPSGVWEASPPEPLYSGGPVIRVMDEARSAISKAIDGERARPVDAK